MAHLVVDMACETISTYRSVATGRGRRTHIDLLLTMFLGGLWHGASWNFVLWGGLHGTYLTIERIFRGEGKVAPASWTTVRAWLRLRGSSCW